MPTFSSRALHALTTLIVSRMGSSPEETEEVADHLVRANLAGHDSHGIGMLPAYIRIFQEGLLVPNQEPATVLDAGALLVIDARRGFGQRMAANAVRRAIGRARELGACVLALRNASHIGRIGTYGELATQAGCAFTAFVNVADTRDAQAPWGCAEARLGTNPFCTAVPGEDGPALLLDMATTTIAAGKVRVAHNKGVAVPDDCLIDDAGRPTNDPSGFIRDRTGAMLSFGRHKGSGLAVMCEIMAAAIGGGQRADQPARGGILNSMLATVIDLSRLGDPQALMADVEATKAHIRTSRVAPGFDEVLLPGEPERRAARGRMADGIAVDDTTWREVREAAGKLGILEAEIDRAVGLT
ncbi:MAG TPA: malate/lactate/ureidoglycolate dehydrogenase [Acetobacteraceae bacterium]|nr:malate/lactate/ureidoglycolate dehydrogenase [Acetobacteraceae bacterium]